MNITLGPTAIAHAVRSTPAANGMPVPACGMVLAPEKYSETDREVSCTKCLKIVARQAEKTAEAAPTFETTTCVQCTGTGEYSYHARNGWTCSVCSGTGRMLTREGRAAKQAHDLAVYEAAQQAEAAPEAAYRAEFERARRLGHDYATAVAWAREAREAAQVVEAAETRTVAYYIVSENADFTVRAHAKSPKLWAAKQRANLLYENGRNGVLVVAATSLRHAIERAERLYRREVPFSTALDPAA